MTFYIPPVFLFGNNANRLHNNEEKKSEYKTAAETEIKVENWEVKRIAELEEENKKLKEELKETQETLEHSDSFFSIMRDVLANDEISNEELASILYCVVHFECGDLEMSKKEVEIAEKFWYRDYV